MLSDVSFECRFSRDGGAVTVTYEIKNDSDRDLGVFNKLKAIAVDGALDFSPDLVYVELDGEVVRFLKMALPIPPGLTMSAYVPPYASLLPRGKTMTETFSVAIPVKVRQPYRRALVSGEVIPAEPRTAKRLEVAIGVFPLGDCHLAAEHPAFPDVATVTPPDPAVTGQVVFKAAFDLDPEVAVLDYKGFPWT